MPTFEGKLCEICATIPFQRLYEDSGEQGESPRWQVGCVSDVRNRAYCPFCQLLLQSVSMKNRTQEAQELATEDRWLDDTNLSVFYEHGRFSCYAKSGSGFHIYFLREERTRILDRNFMDVSRIRQWVRFCSKKHSDCSLPQYTSNDEVPNFRVIDVHRNCIVPMPSSIKYIALSYVWGQVDTYRLLRENLEDLMKPEGLMRVWGNIPLTVRHAVSLTESIGERYLWVDSLCLIQNDDNDMKTGIRHMDTVFGGSFCTLVAASGRDANAGLPGMGGVQRTQHISRVHPGIRIFLKEDLDAHLKQTQYRRRAWTFQEYFLSRRRIVFTNCQVYYVCRKVSWSEEDAVAFSFSAPVDMGLLFLLQTNPRWHEDMETHDIIRTILFYYSNRKLTYARDVINAIGGIFHTLSIRCKCGFFQGMPVAALDLYLLFHTGGLGDYINSPAERRREFPSYSWAGWYSQINFEDFADVEADSAKKKSDWLSNQTWIVWYKYDLSNGAVSLVWDIKQNPGFLEATEDDIGYRERRSFRPKSTKTRLSGNIEITRPSPQQLVIDKTQYSYPLLQFWTVSVFFNVTFSKGQGTIDIFDRNGDHCGCGYQNAIASDIHANESEPIELVILSECWKSGNGDERMACQRTREHMRNTSANEEYSNDFEDHCFFWALWIQWNAGVAERVGIAQIFQTAMEESLEPGPVWKEILLG